MIFLLFSLHQSLIKIQLLFKFFQEKARKQISMARSFTSECWQYNQHNSELTAVFQHFASQNSKCFNRLLAHALTEHQGQAVLTGSKSSFILSIGEACIGSGRAKQSCGCAGRGSGRAKQASSCSCSYRIRGPFPICLVVFQTEFLEENPALFTLGNGRQVSSPHSHSTPSSPR